MRSILTLMLLCGVAVAGRRVVVVETSVEILEPIRFVGATSTLTPTASKTLDVVARTMQGNPSIKKLEVVAFGNDARTDVLNQIGLGSVRAQAIVTELVRRGVAPGRLLSAGEAHPRQGTDPVPVFVLVDR